MAIQWIGAHRALKWTALACSAVAGGCTSFPRNEPGTGYGDIYVGSPRIETNDRLINDRREKEHWLVQRRNELRDAKQGISGVTALSSMSFIGAQANVSVDPLRGVQNIDIGRARQAAQSQADDQRALAALRASERDEIIAKRSRKEITFEQADEQLKKLGLSVTPTSATSPTSTMPTPAASAPNSTLITANAETLKAPAGSADTTELFPTPLQDFYNRLAAYDAVDNEIFAVRGDDAHDLAGNTLYRLAFDTTVLPTNDTSAWAVVTVKIRPETQNVDYPKLLEQSLQRHVALITQTNERAYRVTMRALGKECWATAGREGVAAKDGEDAAVFARGFRCATADLGSNFRAALERHLTPAALAKQGVLNCGRSCDWLNDRRRAIGGLLLDKTDSPQAEKKFADWAVRVAQIFDAQTLSELKASPVSSYATISANPSQPGHFPYALKSVNAPALKANLLANLRTSVYDVAPKESVQQLSEVSNNRKSAELLLGLAASRGNVGLNAALQSIKSNTAQYEALRRQPLVVAFTRRGQGCNEAACSEPLEFGWILGPSFVLSDNGKSARFRHSVSPKTVAASVSLPAWVEALNVEVSAHWIRESDMQTVAAGPATAATKYDVRLPSRYGEVFAGVGRHQEREPRVDEFQDIQVTEDAPAAVNIRGRDLWRSTVVHIGGQRADLVTVHPDRRGITASFDKIASGAGSEVKSGTVKLTVQTSEGDVLAGAVTIRPKAGAPKEEPAPMKITGMLPRIVAEVQQAIELSTALAATDDAVVQVTAEQDQSLKAKLTATTQISTNRKNILFALPEKAVPNLNSGDEIKLALVVTPAKSEESKSIDVRKSVIYYKKADELKAKLIAPAKLTPTLKFKMDLPLNAALAFSAFNGGAAKVKAQAILDGVKDKAVEMEGSCKIVPVKGRRKVGDRDTCLLELQGPKNWSATAKAAELSLGFADKDAPELEGAEKIKLAR